MSIARNKTLLQASAHTDRLTEPDTARQTLDELIASYVQRLPGKLDAIRFAARSLHNGTDTRHALRELQALVHKLSGSAGAYNCPAVGTAARAYENLIDACLDSGVEPDSAALDQFRKNLADLESAVSRRLSEHKTPQPGS
jgi:chemotaxis protein histidine kinase CheA